MNAFAQGETSFLCGRSDGCGASVHQPIRSGSVARSCEATKMVVRLFCYLKGCSLYADVQRKKEEEYRRTGTGTGYLHYATNVAA